MALFTKKISVDFLNDAKKHIDAFFTRMRMILSNYKNYVAQDWKGQSTALDSLNKEFKDDFKTIKIHFDKKTLIYRLYDQAGRIVDRICKTMDISQKRALSTSELNSILDDISTLKVGLDELKRDLDQELQAVR